MAVLQNLQTFIVTIVVSIIGIVAAIFAIKDGIAISKGEGGLLKFLGKIAGVILCIVIVYLSLNFAKYGDTAQKNLDSTVDQSITDITNGVNGGAGKQ